MIPDVLRLLDLERHSRLESTGLERGDLIVTCRLAEADKDQYYDLAVAISYSSSYHAADPAWCDLGGAFCLCHIV